MTLNSERWLQLAMAQASNNLQNRISRDFGGREQIAYNRCEARLIQMLRMACQATKAYKFIRKGPILVQ